MNITKQISLKVSKNNGKSNVMYLSLGVGISSYVTNIGAFDE